MENKRTTLEELKERLGEVERRPLALVNTTSDGSEDPSDGSEDPSHQMRLESLSPSRFQPSLDHFMEAVPQTI